MNNKNIKKPKDSNYLGVISIVSAICSIVCVCLIISNQIDAGGSIKMDVFIGVIATLMALCATIIVAFQVINYFEFRNVKSKIDEIDSLHNIMTDAFDKYNITISNTNRDLSTAFAFLAKKEDNNNQAITYLLLSIILILTVEDVGVIKKYETIVLERFRQLNLKLDSLSHLSRKSALYSTFKELKVPRGVQRHNEICSCHYQSVKKIEKLLEV